MKKPLTFFVYCLLSTVYCLLSSCSNHGENTGTPEEKKTLLSSIDSLQNKMFNPQTMELDKALAAKGVAAFQEYVKKFPADTICAEYLFRSSDLSRALGDNQKAIDYLGRVCKDYPDFAKVPECLFLQGYYYQEFLKDTIHAKEFYNQLIAKYPKHAFVDDAQALMTMFGKSEEDIIKDFEKKDAEKKKI